MLKVCYERPVTSSVMVKENQLQQVGITAAALFWIFLIIQPILKKPSTDIVTPAQHPALLYIYFWKCVDSMAT